MRQRLGEWPVLDVVVGIARTSRPRALLLGCLVLAGGTLPVAVTLATGAVVGRVPAAARDGLGSPSGEQVMGALAVFATVYVASIVAGALQQPLAVAVGLRFALYVREQVVTATTTPVGTAHLEDPAVADELALIENAEVRQALSRAIVPSLCGLAAARLAGVGQAVVLFSFTWWAPLVVFGSLLLTHRWLRREVATFLSANQLATSAVRRANYFRELAVGNQAAKEVRTFGLADWSIDAFTRSWRSAMEGVWRERGTNRVLVLQFATGAALAYGIVFYAIGRAALDGAIGLGQVAVYASAAVGMVNLGYAGDVETLIRQGTPILRRALRLRERIGGAPEQQTARVALDRVVKGIRFADVDFAYPGASGPVLSDLSLDIPAGRSLAIVGVNGAGKTTLIKLLARLREPTAGTIAVDGIPINELPAAAWRAHIAVIFQDFVRYELPLRENVGFGAIGRIDDESAREGALQDAGAGSFAEEIGWAAPLSRSYEGGVDLSGGQWQKVALARAMMAVRGGADVLVLDEPTANLDVRAEAELFDRFLEITEGLTTIVISHRFSTVRRADRICVIDEGRVVECGTHDELMAAAGPYATMFTLQASRFREQVGE